MALSMIYFMDMTITVDIIKSVIFSISLHGSGNEFLLSFLRKDL